MDSCLHRCLARRDAVGRGVVCNGGVYVAHSLRAVEVDVESDDIGVAENRGDGET